MDHIMNIKTQFRFPPEIKLEANSLAEVWLEIQWQLEVGESFQFKTDPGFDIAIGAFYANVKNHQYGHRIALEAAQIPSQMLPHAVRYQFRPSPDGWPLLQLGPGVATVNFTTDYTWETFKQAALFLRTQLINSYEETLKTQALILRYRNAIPFSHSSENTQDFLANFLNLQVQYPSSIPGAAAFSNRPEVMNVALSFALREPNGKGAIKFATGVTNKTVEALVFDFEVSSDKSDVPDLNNEGQYEEWLTKSHSVIHDWYFSIIDGDLRNKYEGKE